ncbi:hypothetical protein [Corynebacterium phoceense]|uniref:hypothetical protein n=1 Tax=Corynebacterium phoceense TaxID=1686286 RepID=UPI0018A92FC9|nr:hypothetical protein [Corynebacterium phoceense]MBF9011698.1 hypothetical protein [Corynebacterium phoceense]
MLTKTLTPIELRAFQQHCSAHPLLVSEGVTAAINITMATGAAVSDVAGLRWFHVDWLDGRVELGHPGFSGPRFAPLSDSLRACLLDIADRQDEFHRGGFVVQDGAGGPWPPMDLANMLRLALVQFFGPGYSAVSLRKSVLRTGIYGA